GLLAIWFVIATDDEPDTRPDHEDPGEHGGDEPDEPTPGAPAGGRGRDLRLRRLPVRTGLLTVRAGLLTVRAGRRLP
ncbi:hypothetical protein GTW37_40015, partial [Streptomyces sp. SID4931]|nr:hypothetical protein [Streptomyces sp. SID4931]